MKQYVFPLRMIPVVVQSFPLLTSTSAIPSSVTQRAFEDPILQKDNELMFTFKIQKLFDEVRSYLNCNLGPALNSSSSSAAKPASSVSLEEDASQSSSSISAYVLETLWGNSSNSWCTAKTLRCEVDRAVSVVLSFILNRIKQ